MPLLSRGARLRSIASWPARQQPRPRGRPPRSSSGSSATGAVLAHDTRSVPGPAAVNGFARGAASAVSSRRSSGRPRRGSAAGEHLARSLPQRRRRGELGARDGQPAGRRRQHSHGAIVTADRGGRRPPPELTACRRRGVAADRRRIRCSPSCSSRAGARRSSTGASRDAYEHLRRIFDPADTAYHHVACRGWAFADLVDAAIHDVVRLAEARGVSRRTSSR